MADASQPIGAGATAEAIQSAAPDAPLLWAKGEDGEDLIHSTEEDLRVMEPGCLTVLRGFSAKEFMYSSFAFYKAHPSALRKEILSGITLALIEVPESIAFAFMAGLGPSYGMASVVWMGTLTGFFGGRPAMISGAAGAMAVVMGNLTREDGPLRDFTREERVEHLMMCILLIGALEFLCGPFLCAFVKIIPQSAMIGFMNALALILFIGQSESFKICSLADTTFNDCPMKNHVWLHASDVQTWTTLALILVTLFIMWGLPKIKRFGIGHIIPASLAAIVVGTAIEWGIFRTVLLDQGGGTRTVGETAMLEAGLPGFHFPVLPEGANWRSIWMYAISLTLVGGVETVMTHEVVNSLLKEPPSSFDAIQECSVQGIANFLTGLFGGMGGSALVGETVINVLHGARGRLSGTTAGITMLFIMLGLAPLVRLLPIAVLTGIIWTVAVHTFQWKNLRHLHKVPRADAFIIVLVTVVSVVTNLAVGIAIGVAVASMWHVWESGNLMTASALVGIGAAPAAAAAVAATGEKNRGMLKEGRKEGGEEVGKENGSMKGKGGGLRKLYKVNAPLFFGSTRPMLRVFNYLEDPDDVVVDLSVSHGGIMDLSGITALNEAGKSYGEVGKHVTLVGLDPKSLAMIAKYPDMASHLIVPGLRQGGEEGWLEGYLGEVMTVGPEGIELGLEMDVDEPHPTEHGEVEVVGMEEGRQGEKRGKH